jgi:UDP-glucose 4-epimerase
VENVIIVGAFGFLGFHLSKRLLEEGVNVYGINLQQGFADNWKEEKLMEIGRNSNLHQLEEVDFHQNEEIKSVKFDAIYFFLDSVLGKEMDLPYVKEQLNKVIEWGQEHSTKLIFSSSLEVIDHSDSVITEESSISPINENGEIFQQLEEQLHREYAKTPYPFMILRLPTVYGPWQPENYVYQKALRMVEEGKPFEWEEDKYIGDVLFVEDVVNAMILAGGSSYKNEVIHVTSGKEGEWLKGLNLIIGNTAYETRPKKLTLSNQKLIQLLSCHPKITIDIGISKQRSHLNRLRWEGHEED